MAGATAARYRDVKRSKARPLSRREDKLPGGTDPYRGILVLQRAAGNQAVGRWLQSDREAILPEADFVAESQGATGLTQGQPLDPGTRSFMESRLRHDFKDVRLHVYGTGAEKAEQLGAEAITAGKEIFLAQGTYEPGTAAGRAVLAHELTHVVQQGRQGKGKGAGEAELEAEANRAGLQVARGFEAEVHLAAAQPVLKMSHQAKIALWAAAGGLALAGAGLGLAALAGATMGTGAALGILAGGAVAGFGLGWKVDKTPLEEETEEADKLIRGRFGANLAKAVGSPLRQATIKVVSDDQFKEAYLASGQDPKDYADTIAFVDRSTTLPTVWIHRDRQDPDTLIHEGLHLYSDPTFKQETAKPIDEGVTEYFTREIAEAQKIKITHAYEAEYRQIVALVEALGPGGEEILRAAYFEGRTAELCARVNQALCDPQAFSLWLLRMVLGAYEAAEEMMRRKKSGPCALRPEAAHKQCQK
jgi:hypothetical protein